MNYKCTKRNTPKSNSQKNINELQTYEKKWLTSPIIRKKIIL